MGSNKEKHVLYKNELIFVYFKNILALYFKSLNNIFKILFKALTQFRKISAGAILLIEV